MIYALKQLVHDIHLYQGALDHYHNTGAAEMLHSLLPSPVVYDYDTFFGNYSAYQLVIWTDHDGWHKEERRLRGPRGATACILPNVSAVLADLTAPSCLSSLVIAP